MLSQSELVIESFREIGGVDGFRFEALGRFPNIHKKVTFTGVISGSALIPREHLKSCAEFWIRNKIMDARNRPLGFFLESANESERTFDLVVLSAEHAYVQVYLERIPVQLEVP